MNSGELGHFKLLEKIGEGGMGRVYKARDQRLDRFVAIKLISEARSSDTVSRARFLQEARTASALNHPNIVTIYEIGEQDGVTFIAMELVDGKSLDELIPSKGMRLTLALRLAAQVADAVAAAHKAGIVHRDLKPSNIMVDASGRVRVLDFGLAKLMPVAPLLLRENESTLAASAVPLTSDRGVIVGSIAYMSPEQAEGKPVDARSDIFSFGAVLYEMITGQRAFRGESAASVLAAVITSNPPSVTHLSSATPAEVERVISRCMRKDVNRRSQNMADVKLALEELRDDSESGALAKPAASAQASGRLRSRQKLITASGLILLAAVLGWFYFISGDRSRSLSVERLSPDDGHSYVEPAIAPDGAFVAYISDRSGQDQLWLQQRGGGSPIQLTHSSGTVGFPAFFPDGKGIVYVASSPDDRQSSIEVISTLGGEPRVLAKGGKMENWAPMLSPDGRKLAFFELETDGHAHLMVMSSAGGRREEVQAWWRMHPIFYGRATWTSDNRHLITLLTPKWQTTQLDWFAVPLDGSEAKPMGAAQAFQAAGMGLGSAPMVMVGNRALSSRSAGVNGLLETEISPATWRVVGSPRQLTSGTEFYEPYSVSNDGVVAAEVSDLTADLYLLPLSSDTGLPTGVVQRLTHDHQDKELANLAFGNPGSAYFQTTAIQNRVEQWRLIAVDLTSRKQTLAFAVPFQAKYRILSSGAGQIAYSVLEGNSWSIRLAGADEDSSDGRTLCQGCGFAYQFSPDGRFLLYAPDIHPDDVSTKKRSIRLLELSTGKNKPWIEDASDSIRVTGAFGTAPGWIMITAQHAGSKAPLREYLVPWNAETVARSKWIEMPLADKDGNGSVWKGSPDAHFFYTFEGSKLMGVPFDTVKQAFGKPSEIVAPVGSERVPKPTDFMTVRAQGLVFSREEGPSPSIWLMKLPR